MRERLPRRLQVALTAGTLAGALALAGCAPSEAAPTPTSVSPSPTAFFASDEEALAAATAAYDAYLKVAGSVTADPEHDSSKLAAVAVDTALQSELTTAQSYAAKSWHSVGSTTFDSLKIERVSPDGSAVVYLCVDVSKVDVVDASGASVVPPDRLARFPLEVSLRPNGADRELIVAENAPWSGANFC